MARYPVVMHISASAIICAVRPHGEAGAVVRAMTAEHGMIAGYVRGGRSRTMRPVLQPSNIVRAEFRARVETQLPALTVELEQSRGPLMAEPLAASALDWATALTASVVPEMHPYPAIHSALDGLLNAIEAAPAARGWAGALVSYEALILSALGFGNGEGARSDGWDGVHASLNASGARLARYLFADRRADVLAARERLVERLKRAAA
jgi:DNA repair protein RecO (recombination protein O)